MKGYNVKKKPIFARMLRVQAPEFMPTGSNSRAERCTFVDTAGTTTTLQRTTYTSSGMFNTSRTVYELVQPTGNTEVKNVGVDPRTWTVTLDGQKHLLVVDEAMRRSVLDMCGGWWSTQLRFKSMGVDGDTVALDSLDFGAVAGVPEATPEERKSALIQRFKGSGPYRQYGMQLGDDDCAAFVGDADVVRAAMQTPGCRPEDEVWKMGGPFQFAGASLRADRTLVLEMAHMNGCVIQHATAALRDDREIARAAVKSAPRALKWLGPETRSDVDFLVEHFVQPGHLREIGKFGEPHALSVDLLLQHAPRHALDEVSRNNDWPAELCDGLAKAMGPSEPKCTTVTWEGAWKAPKFVGGSPKHPT